MIYMIGGAARAGKTTIARRLLRERNIPYFCLDYFIFAGEQGKEEPGDDLGTPNIVRDLRMWPQLRLIVEEIIRGEPEYAVEGDALLPRGVNALREKYGEQVRACFLGYTGLSAERKLEQLRRFGGGPEDWLQQRSDRFVLELAQHMISFSLFLRSECEGLGIPFFDVSADFPRTMERAFEYLQGGSK